MFSPVYSRICELSHRITSRTIFPPYHQCPPLKLLGKGTAPHRIHRAYPVHNCSLHIIPPSHHTHATRRTLSPRAPRAASAHSIASHKPSALLRIRRPRYKTSPMYGGSYPMQGSVLYWTVARRCMAMVSTVQYKRTIEALALSNP